jgi:hypothetical protein
MLLMQSTRSQHLVAYREFTKVTTEGTITHAILYHYEQVWYAAWLPPKGKETDYVYGYTYAYKDTATACKVYTCCFKIEQRRMCLQTIWQIYICYLYTTGN